MERWLAADGPEQIVRDDIERFVALDARLCNGLGEPGEGTFCALGAQEKAALVERDRDGVIVLRHRVPVEIVEDEFVRGVLQGQRCAAENRGRSQLLFDFGPFRRVGRKCRQLLAQRSLLLQFRHPAHAAKQRGVAALFLQVADHHNRAIVGIFPEPVENHHPRQAVLEEQFVEIALADEMLRRAHRCRRRPGVKGIGLLFCAIGQDHRRLVFGGDVAAEDAHRAVVTGGAVHGHDGRHAIVGVRDPALRVPDFHAAIRPLAIDPLAKKRRRGDALVMNRADVEPLQERVLAVGEKLVERVGRGIATCEQNLRAARAGFLDALGHRGVKLAKARFVGAPAGDGNAVPRFIPQLDRGEVAVRPAVLAADRGDEFLEVGIVRR